MLFVLVVALLLIATLKPTWNAVHSYRQAGAAKERLRQVQVEHAALERQVKRARSEATLQREARRQGMIKPGEQAWVVNGIK